MKDGCTLLGWDTAWTPNGSGAWSVLKKSGVTWKVLLVENTPVGKKEVGAQLNELVTLYQPRLITLDMPISRRPISGYRASDRETTRAFSKFGCPVHSPNTERPGPWGAWITNELIEKGYHIEVQDADASKGMIEVYPHTVALEILREQYRIPYKIQRASGYYPDLTTIERKQHVCLTLERMVRALADRMSLQEEPFDVNADMRISDIKQMEDRVDALLCAWAGVQALDKRYIPYGDADSAIWNPDLKELDPGKEVG